MLDVEGMDPLGGIYTSYLPSNVLQSARLWKILVDTKEVSFVCGVDARHLVPRTMLRLE